MQKRILLFVASLVVLVFALPFAFERVAREKADSNVLLVVDWDDIEWFARTKGTDPLFLVEELKKEGFTTLGVSEWSLKSLKNRGVLVPAAPKEGAPRYLQYFAVSSPRVLNTLVQRLRKVGKRVEIFDNLVGVSLLPEEEEKIGLGWDEELLEALKSRGFSLILRPYNYLGISQEILSALLEEKAWSMGEGVICSGDSILGYGDWNALKGLAQFLRVHKMFFGYVEFVGQKGEDVLASFVPEWTVRVHSIPPDELKNYTPSSARERFIRALKERSVRVLYLRLFTEPSFRGWERNLEYLRALRRDVLSRGMSFGVPALPHGSFAPPLFLLCIFAIGAGIFSFFVLRSFFSLPSWVVFILIALLLGLLAWDRLWGMKILGLWMGVSAPTLSVFLLIDEFSEGRRGWGIVLAFLVSMAGAFAVAQGLYHWLFVLRIEQYFGVKVTLTLPLLLVLLYLFRRRFLEGSIVGVLLENLRRFELLVCLFLGVAFMLYLTRSGNFPLLGAGELESRMRGLLERLLFARPRTKEFLIGYPALWLCASFSRRPLRPVYRLVLWLGVTVGFVTLLNSFCHLHTPLLFVLLRFVNALALSFPVFVVYYLLILLGLFLWKTVGRWGE